MIYNEPMDFVYPYIFPNPNDGGEELKYSLRSLECHFDDFRVIIIGQRPKWIQNIEYIELERQLPPWQDVNRKIYYLLNMDILGNDFIFMNDDFYLCQDMQYDDFSELKAMKLLNGGNIWDGVIAGRERESLRALNNSYVRLRERFRELKIWDYETHLPRLFNKNELLELYDEFALQNNQLAISTLYFNYFYRDSIPKIVKDYSLSNDVVLRIKVDVNYTEALFKMVISNKLFITNNARSFFRVRDRLTELFPEPSSFEI